MRRSLAPLALVALLTAMPFLTACQGKLAATRQASEYAALASGKGVWFDRPQGLRIQAAMLIRTFFAKVPLVTFVVVDGSGQLEFVALSDWGARLADGSLSATDPAPAHLQPMLARIPGLAPKLSLAMMRVFLIWPQAHSPLTPQASTDEHVRYAFLDSDALLTQKSGQGADGAWSVSLRYPTGATPQDPPEEITYQGAGLELVFKLRGESSNE